MRERAALLNIVAELRGRLDELEAMIKTAPNYAIMTPASFDEEGIVDLTPETYRRFRASGLEAGLRLKRYEVFQSFAQVGAPQGAGDTELTSFPLSDLHRTGPEPAFGLHFQPLETAAQSFFTYEVLAPGEFAHQYQWLEWVLKLSFERPVQCFAQVVMEGEGFIERLDVGATQMTEFPTFRHVRIDRGRLMDAAAGRPIRRLRLTFATGGLPLAMDLFALSLFGRA